MIFAPFNTTLGSEDLGSQPSFDLDNRDVIHYGTRVREANRQYEYNYNGEVDNGMVIRDEITEESSLTGLHLRASKGDSSRPVQPLELLVSQSQTKL